MPTASKLRSEILWIESAAVSSYSQFQELMFRYSAESGYRVSVDFNDSYSS